MKPEKILELINKMDLNAEEKRFIETLKKETDADLRGFNSPLVCIEKLRRMAVDEINKTEAKAAGDGERKKAAEQILKRFETLREAVEYAKGLNAPRREGLIAVWRRETVTVQRFCGVYNTYN